MPDTAGLGNSFGVCRLIGIHGLFSSRIWGIFLILHQLMVIVNKAALNAMSQACPGLDLGNIDGIQGQVKNLLFQVM